MTDSKYDFLWGALVGFLFWIPIVYAMSNYIEGLQAHIEHRQLIIERYENLTEEMMAE